MTPIEALILGGVQGLTEFLPISSSGHEVLTEAIVDSGLEGENKVAWVVLTHLASALAIIVFLLWDLRKSLATSDGPEPGSRSRWSALIRWGLFIGLGTVPAGLVYLFAKDRIEEAFNSPTLVAGALLVNGCILFAVQRMRPGGEARVDSLDPRSRTGLRVLGVGVAQAFAIVPGLSRSGLTISTGLWAGLDRSEAVRFSFYLGLVAILGATAVKADTILRLPALLGDGVVIAGFVASFVVSLGSLWLLLALVRGMRLDGFAYYCWAVALTVFVLGSTGGI